MEDEVHHEVREMTCCSGWVVAAGKQDSMAICEVMTRTETRGAATRQNASKSYGDRSTIASRRCNVAIMFARKFTTTDYIKESLVDSTQQTCTFAQHFFFCRVEQNHQSFPRNAFVAQHALRTRSGTVSAVRGSVFDVRCPCFPESTAS